MCRAVAFRSGRGIVSNAHELGLTIAAAYKLWPATDLMIGIGTRLELPASGSPDGHTSRQGLKSVRIDIDPVEMRRVTTDVAVVADFEGRHCRPARGRAKGRIQQNQRDVAAILARPLPHRRLRSSAFSRRWPI